jgi:prepilin-type N-terminal cleavage/methylation domain-containing protein
MKIKFFSYQRGFTIVELLIVIVIIGILAAITVAAYNGVQERARMASAQSFAAQIKNQHFHEAGGYWTFDECNGSVVQDKSDQPVTTTVTGTALWSSDTPSGTGCSFQFNGSTRIFAGVTFGTSYYLKAAWIKISSCGSSNNIMSRPDSGGTDAAFYAQNCILKAGNVNYIFAVSPNTITANQWHYVVTEYENGTVRLYEDGKLVREVTGATAPTALVGVNIGAHITGNYFSGLMDDVLFVSR